MNEVDKMISDMMDNLENKDEKKSGTKNALNHFFSLPEYEDDFVLVDVGRKRRIRNFYICRHQVTQKEFSDIIGNNPSFFQLHNIYLQKKVIQVLEEQGTTDFNPVEYVSYYDAVFYCNKRSILEGLSPVYSINGKTNPDNWNYIPCKGNELEEITENGNANGYRLPSEEEWLFAAIGGEDFMYAGSNRLDDIAWCAKDIRNVFLLGEVNYVHPVMQKKANGYGLYDMTGNVWEWSSDLRFAVGGGYDSGYNECYIQGGKRVTTTQKFLDPDMRYDNVGFRVVRTAF